MWRGLLVWFVASASAGCVPSSQIMDTEILFVEGCVLSIDGITVAQAEEIVRSWSFEEGCEVRTSSEHGETD